MNNSAQSSSALTSPGLRWQESWGHLGIGDRAPGGSAHAQVLRECRPASQAPGVAPLSPLREVIFPHFPLCLAQQGVAGESSRWEEEAESGRE